LEQLAIAEKLRQLISENATGTLNHDNYEATYEKLSERYKGIEFKLHELRTKITQRNAKKQCISEHLDCLDSHENLVT